MIQKSSILLILIWLTGSVLSAVVHNPALSSDSVILVSHPASSTPPVTISITWPFTSAPPTTGTLTATIQNGSDRVAILDESGNESSTRSWSSPFPSSFQIRAKAKSSSANDVVLNIQHDSGPVGSRVLTVSAPVPTPPVATQDGSESGSFDVEIQPVSVTPSSYEWVYVVPEAAGRAPTGDIFDDKTKRQPKVSLAKWFAPTDNQYRTTDGPTAVYKVKCTVTIGSDVYESLPVDWAVWAYKNPVTNRPTLTTDAPSGALQFSITGDGESLTSEVTGHALTRNAASINPDGLLNTNSFHAKIITSHEGRHVHQWTSMQPWSDYYSPSKVYQLFAGKKKTGSFNEVTAWQTDTRTQAAQVLATYVNLCNSEANRTHHHREHDAHATSNAIDPPYLRSDYMVEYPNIQPPAGNAPEPVLN